MCVYCSSDDVNASLCDMLHDAGFSGIDVSAEISLIEYGLLVKYVNNGGGPFLSCIVGVGLCDDGGIYNRFDSFSIDVKELKNFFKQNSWASEKAVLDCCGCTKKQWRAASLVSRLFDLIGYYGYENILGSSYYPKKLADMVNAIL